MKRTIKLTILICCLVFLSQIISYGVFIISRSSDLKYIINVPITVIEIVILFLITWLLLNNIGIPQISLIIIGVLIAFVFPIVSIFVPDNLKPERQFYGIRTTEIESGFILSDEFCHISCPRVKQIVAKGKIHLSKGTETYVERKFFSYREAYSLGRNDIDDKCCMTKTFSPYSGIEKFLFSIRLVCEQTYYYFLSNLLLVFVILVVDFFKKEKYFKIDKMEFKKMIILTSPIILILLLFNVLYFIELSKL